MKSALSIIGVGALALLTGCNQGVAAANGDLAGGSKYCAPFKAAATTAGPPAVGDPAGAFDDCIHRWGYTLASARDPADVVAQATVNACSSILQTWSQQLESQDQSAAPQDDRTSDQQLTPAQQQIRIAESRALLYVVQARAGSCAPPPPNTLLTTG